MRRAARGLEAQVGRLMVAATLVVAACSSDGTGGTDGGGGNAGTGAGGRGGFGASGGRGGSGGGTAGAAGTTGAGGTSGGSGAGGRGGGGGGGRGGTGAAGSAGGGGAAGRGGAAGGDAGVGGGAAGRGGAAGGDAGVGGGAAGSGGTGGGGGQSGPCGGMTCTDAQYCDWQNNQCGSGISQAMCNARSQGCIGLVDPICGCDGQVYSNECLAGAAGHDIDETGIKCTPPSGTFACGPRFCTHGSQYCEAKVGGAVGAAGTYACRPLPVGCLTATPSCACVAGAAQCGNCTMSAAGDLTTHCYLP